MYHFARIMLLFLPVLVFAAIASAQDLEPRAFSPAPVGLNIVSVAYNYADGNVFFDQSLPVEDATGSVHTATVAYLRTLSVFGATAKLTVAVPFAWGDYEGLWTGEPAFASRRGFRDPAVGLTVAILGAPVLEPEQLRSYREKTVAGVSVMTVAPLGQYDSDQLINLGSNRWAFRTRLGLSHRVGRWILETMGDVWFFTENSNAFGNVSINQEPIASIQLNAVYQTRRGFWIGCGYGYGEGGQTTVSGQEKNTSQVNRRLGVTLVYPIDRHNSLKITYINSLSAVIGADFDLVGLSWRVLIS